jgi:hypothetical protein
MGKRGPPPLPDAEKKRRSTFQKVRSHPPVVAQLPGDPEKPSWLTGMGADLWFKKVAVYRYRGQSVRGCESALAQYCAVEASLIAAWITGESPSASMLNVFHKLGVGFFELPAAQISQSTGAPTPPAMNRFAQYAIGPDDDTAH